jgi:hypothetical protein
MVFADSVNLARRLSSKNENDLVQESILGNGKKNKDTIFLVLESFKLIIVPKAYDSYYY